MNRPTLSSAVAALRFTDTRFDWIGPTDTEDDVAALLEVVETDHHGDADEPDSSGYWGRCPTCDAPWPCQPWIDAEYLAVQFLGRIAARTVAHARTAIATANARRADRDQKSTA